MALKDYIAGEVSLPPTVVVNGQKVAIHVKHGYDWWAASVGRVVAWAVTEGRRSRDASVADLCRMTEAEVDALGGVGPKTLERIKKWLDALGLRLRDPNEE